MKKMTTMMMMLMEMQMMAMISVLLVLLSPVTLGLWTTSHWRLRLVMSWFLTLLGLKHLTTLTLETESLTLTALMMTLLRKARLQSHSQTLPDKSRDDSEDQDNMEEDSDDSLLLLRSRSFRLTPASDPKAS